MKGYEGMSKDMTCRGMKFEIGKTYHVDGDISVCKNGLHFCEKLIDVLRFYDNDGSNRFFEVEVDGVIKTYRTMCVASSLTVIREIKGIELNRAVHDPGYGYGNGYGDIYGDGYGDGSGYGYRYYGDGYCFGDGSDYGYRNGDGYLYIYNDGDAYGNGSGGNGYGDGKRYNYVNDIIKYA